jgi:23S rRNA (cytosine1962-C5)-methyltransferase
VTPELIACVRDAIAAPHDLRRDDERRAAVHAEGDDLGSIVIDRFDDVVVVEIANCGAEHFKPTILETLQRELAPRVIYFKNDLPARKLEAEHGERACHPEPAQRGEGPPSQERGGSFAVSAAQDDSSTQILESGLKFHVDPSEGQKTGFFLDQRENRRLARTLAGGKRVLNLFSYSGAFGVYAAAGGATSFTNVDVSARAIEVARENASLNGFEGEHIVADAFQYVRTRHDPFDR